ncbi:hypothetical protein [Actinokineospora cianjurensis]|nr:hypothetical protein [Actinokineospora cianjurensis]
MSSGMRRARRDGTGAADDHAGVRTDVEPPIAAPPAGVIAVRDRTTSVLVRVWDQQYRPGISHRAMSGFFLLVVAFSALVQILAGDPDGSPSRIHLVTVVAFLLGYLLPGSHVFWRPLALRRLGTEPWRAVPARVLRAGRRSAVVEVTDDGDPVRFTVWIDPAHLAMVTDTVYLVRGKGDRAVVRVPGSREPFPAKVSRRPVTPVEIPAVPVTQRWAEELRDRVRRVYAQAAVALGVVLIIAEITTPSLVTALIWLGFTLIVGLAVATTTRHRALDLRLPALVDSAEWLPAEADLGPWLAQHDGTVPATATLTFDDGTVRVVVMPAASVDLIGAISDSAELWITGIEGRVAVGFPGYPLLAVGEVVSA